MTDVITLDDCGGRANRGSSMALPSSALQTDSAFCAQFTFPFQPESVELEEVGSKKDLDVRPASMHIEIPRSNVMDTHRRTSSTLPNFSFNANDISGLQDDETPPVTPDENVAVTPSRRKHKRSGSEFVGGDSRLGVSSAVSSSPTKATFHEAAVMSMGPPSGRRGHAHRRSAAISNHDLSKLVQSPADVPSRLSSSLPNTPLEHPAYASAADSSIVPHVLDYESSGGCVRDAIG